MSSWNYQVMRRKVPKDEEWAYTDGYEYGIHEYYPPSEGLSKGGWTKNPEIKGESVEDLENQLKFMMLDIEKYGIKDWDTGK